MSETSISHEQAMKKTHTRLKTNALNFWEILAQAVALISPSMTAALIVPLMFGTAGTAGWLCYLFGTIMLLFVAFSLNQFSRRYTSAGSMYEYTVKGLGVVVAVFSLVGFECATAFGEEARNPLRTIPRAVIASLLLTGSFFIFITYVETHALANNVPSLDMLDAPLTTLSQNLGVKWM